MSTINDEPPKEECKGRRRYDTWPAAIASIAEDIALVIIIALIAQCSTGAIW